MSEKTVYVIELNDKLSPGLKKAAAEALGLDNAIGKVNNSGNKGFNNLKSSVMGLLPALGAAAVAMKGFQFASESVTEARKFESLTNAITFASGSMEEGAKNMDFLRQRSEMLGTNLLSSVEGFKTLSASMMGSSLEGQATRDIFDGVQVAVSAMGLDAENAKGTFLALGQIMGKGKVQAEELRGQIGERIPGAFNIAARAMGVSTAQLNKMMEQGQLMSEDFLPKFADELKKTFGGALPKSTKSSAAEFNRFQTTMLNLKVELGNSLIPMVNRVMNKFKELYDFIKTRAGLIKTNIIEPFQNLYESVKPAFDKIKSAIFDIFGVNSWGGLFDKGLSLMGDFIQTLKVIIVPIYNTIAGISEAFANMFESTSTASKDTFRRDMIADLAYYAKYAETVFIGLGRIVSGALKPTSGGLQAGVQKIFSAGELARAAEQRALNDFDERKKKEAKTPTKKTVGTGLSSLTSSFDELLKKGATGEGSLGADGKPTKKATTSVDEIKSGRPMNIYIDINKLVESFNVTATNIDDMNNKVKDMVAQALLTAVNNVNLIAK